MGCGTRFNHPRWRPWARRGATRFLQNSRRANVMQRPAGPIRSTCHRSTTDACSSVCALATASSVRGSAACAIPRNASVVQSPVAVLNRARQAGVLQNRGLGRGDLAGRRVGRRIGRIGLHPGPGRSTGFAPRDEPRRGRRCCRRRRCRSIRRRGGRAAPASCASHPGAESRSPRRRRGEPHGWGHGTPSAGL